MSLSTGEMENASLDSTRVIQESPAILELKKILLGFDKEAERLGADNIRKTIANVLEDFSEPAGKESARLAIRDIRKELQGLKGRQSGTRRRPEESVLLSEMDFEEATA